MSDSERRVLEALLALNGRAWVSELAEATGSPESSIMSIVELLKSKGLVQEEVVVEEKYQLTREGKRVVEEGFPEEKLLNLLLEKAEPLSIREAIERIGKIDTQIGIGALKRRGAVEVRGGVISLTRDPRSDIEFERRILESISRGEKIEAPEDRIRVLESRGFIERKLVKRVRIRANTKLVEKVLKEAGETISRLTSKHITSGSWRRVVLREYNVEARPPTIYPGLRHFYKLFIKLLRRKLLEMGFTEYTGPFIEQEFWNFDMLFQAQDHPAREVHDTFRVLVEPGEVNAPKELIDRVRVVHEKGGSTGSKGWGYKWSLDAASRYVLRSQTTSVTIRALATLKPKPPFRIFTIGKVYRPDVIDSKHLPEFYQLDSIVSEPEMNFSKLLGYLKEFFERLGFEKIKFQPSYFPFTEPSVEGYLYIEGLGWVEVFGAGMFRPEVLEMAGVDYRVGAWGMGIDRIAMAYLGIDDIRKLYSRNVSQLRELYKNAIARILKLGGGV